MSYKSLPVRQAPPGRAAARPRGPFAWAFGQALALALAVVAALFALPETQAATACDGTVKKAVAEALGQTLGMSEEDQLAKQAELYAQYAYCAQDNPPATSVVNGAKYCAATVQYQGSVVYEEMDCCGYDPQRRAFGCPIRIKRNYGFGPAPLPGSREYVLHCVADAAGVFWPVGDDSVHLANSLAAPPWQFAVIANATANLGLVQPMSGATRSARSILSWGFKPTGCTYQPIWGNWLDYRIRLDQ
jgi:hypothetical protein